MCSNILCRTFVIIMELVFKGKLRSYQQQYSHSVFIQQDEGGHYQAILHNTNYVNHPPCKLTLWISTHSKCPSAAVKLLCIYYT